MPLTGDELARVGGGIVLSHARIAQLEAWVDAHYREALSTADLADPQLGEESVRALSALDQLLECR